MANTVFQLRRNAVSGTRPTTTTVSQGELAINTTDGILFSANATTVFEIGGNLTSIAVGNSTVRQTANSSGLFVNGSVGIGTSSSTYDLTVNGGTLGTSLNDTVNAFQVYALSNNADYLNFYKIRQTAANSSWETAAWRIQQVVDVTSQGYIQFNGSGATDTISFGTGNTERMRIGSSGNVGIGNSSPDAKLAVTGTANVSGNVVIGGTATVAANLVIGASGDLLFTNGAGVQANGSLGTAGQVLSSNGTGVYWATAAGGGSVNTAAQYSWTNTHSFASNVTFTSTTASGNATSGAVILSGGLGVANNIYAAGRLGFSNSTNISVAYQYYNSTNNSIDTVFG